MKTKLASELSQGDRIRIDGEVETVSDVRSWADSPFPDTAQMVELSLRRERGEVARAVHRNFPFAVLG